MKIGQLSKASGLSTYTIRYYEKMGLLDTATKDNSGHRIYNEKDLDLINWISCLKNSGMPLQTIKRYSEAYRGNKKTTLVDILELHLSKLKAQQLDTAHYIAVTDEKLKKLKNA